jgi:hypothetical protein
MELANFIAVFLNLKLLFGRCSGVLPGRSSGKMSRETDNS